jgi:RHS repeat-associated protein
MTEIGSSTPTYDANGDVTNDFLHTYAWDANGRPVTIDGVSVMYDALGRMVERSNGTYTQIVYTPSGAKLAILSGSTLQKAFVPLPGGSAAVYNSSGLAYYRHSDWLGSSRFASTPSRAMYYDGAYGPFGELYAQTGTTDVSFTGMNQDTVANLYDFPAREYGTQGRWPSPDPSGLLFVHLRDPQTLNRYAYVNNNPLSFTDPLGLGVDADGNCVPDAFTACVSATLEQWEVCYVACGTEGGPGLGEGISDELTPPPQAPTCTASQQAAAKLANAFANASSSTGWIAFASGVGTLLAGAGEGVTFGGDTPVTITFASIATFFSTASFATGAMASTLNSFASGNMDAVQDFNSSQVTNLVAQTAASKIPLVARWAETIGDLAEQAADLSVTATEACR